MLGKFPMEKLSKDAVAGYMSILESEAGIMPRAIHHIFQGLQRQVSDDAQRTGRRPSLFAFQYVDYTVKITYLELYNEELTDLLADVTNEQPEKIKIYEDKDTVARRETGEGVRRCIATISRRTRSSERLKRRLKRLSTRSKFWSKVRNGDKPPKR